MERRHFLAAALAAGVAPRLLAAPSAAAVDAVDAADAADAAPVAIGAAWRAATSADAPQQAGVLELDWARREVRVRHAVALPGRAHGVLAEPGGHLLVVAARPGTWLLRIDAEGRAAQRLRIDDETPRRRFDGHVAASVDGRWLYTAETDTASGQGWISVRERASLRKQAEWPTRGVEPHQLLVDARGVWVANGGICRDAAGRKVELDRMASSLVCLDADSGMLAGQWRLADPRLSLRHLAIAPSSTGQAPRLGIALQAEHDDPARRAEAPVLAVLDGDTLALPAAAGDLGGYAGDITATDDGGFVVSGQRSHRAARWTPQRPGTLEPVAQLQEACALASHDGAVLVAAARGVGRWHAKEPAAMLAWPSPMALDNHWTVMAA